MTIGEKIKAERERQGITQVQLAKMSNLSGGASSVAKVERSDNMMLKTLENIARALKKEPADFFL